MALIAFIPFIAFADENIEKRFDEILTKQSWQFVIIASLIIGCAVLLSLVKKDRTEGFKKIMFFLIAAPTIMTTLYLTAGTVYLNNISSSGGPVHWHADFIISHCEESIDLLNPTGLSNRIGTPVLHEHNDNRIHVEGVVIKPYHINLRSFFEVIGGSIKHDKIVFPTDTGLKTITNGDACPDGRKGIWQIFIYQTRDKTVRQHKETDPENYILSPFSTVPPGDCIVFEFSPDIKDKTDKLCGFYKIELNKGTYNYIH